MSQLHPLLQKRYSPRRFKNREIPEKDIESIIEAARWSASAFNEQPWRFIVGNRFKDEESWNKIYQSLVEFNQKWNKQTPLFIVFLAHKKFKKNNKDNPYYAYDTGQAAAMATVQAMHLGLYCHQMGGFESDILRKHFHINEELEILSVMAIGYLGEPSDTEPEFYKMELEPRHRIALQELVLNHR